MPPSYESKLYWDTRFKDEESFEWLLGADCLNSTIRCLIGRYYHEGAFHNVGDGPRVLHIGCGNSDLSFQLRELVESPVQVTNVDYSAVVVEKGQQKEKHLHRLHSQDSSASMNWKAVDLLSSSCPQELAPFGSDGFNIIVDKSVSDSISCADDVEIKLPDSLRPLSEAETGTMASSRNNVTYIHPLHVLAVNLATVARPGSGHWIVLSYSGDRFPFLSPSAAVAGADSSEGFYPDPCRLWSLERKERIVVPEKDTFKDHRYSGPVHRPETAYWLYILVRNGTLEV